MQKKRSNIFYFFVMYSLLHGFGHQPYSFFSNLLNKNTCKKNTDMTQNIGGMRHLIWIITKKCVIFASSELQTGP